jgi:hypothetical protein
MQLSLYGEGRFSFNAVAVLGCVLCDVQYDGSYGSLLQLLECTAQTAQQLSYRLTVTEGVSWEITS